jgi:hypothetical protein
MKIDVLNFQALGHAVVDAEGLTVIVGPSDRGKSALLRAIEAGLFNRAGEGFVRVGQSSARVRLELNGTGPAHAIEWEKGGGQNRFNVDGTDYGRVGRDAPPILRALGFRDEVIGGKLGDDHKLVGGETLRPQVARQFDPIFLLDQPGSFLNEVMVKLSRLGVLQRANRTCSGDLRTAKTKLGTQAERAQQARAAAEALHPVVALREHVEVLSEWVVELGRVETTITTLTALLARRAAVQALAGRALPKVQKLRVATAQTIQRGLVTATLRALVTQRATCAPRVQPLPAATRLLPSWVQLADSLGPLQRLLGRRALVRTGVLPPPRLGDLQVVARIRQWEVLTPLFALRVGAQAIAQTYSDAAVRWATEQTKAVKAYETTKKKLKVCPTCGKPF